MSFRMQIDPRSRKAARFISRVQRELQNAFLRASPKGMTQQSLARKLEIDRSAVNRTLQGGGNLTLRTIADYAWALGCDVSFSLEPEARGGANYSTAASSGVAQAPSGVAFTATNTFVLEKTVNMRKQQTDRINEDA